MSLVLQPQSEFAIVRQIANHIDTGTYYVRAEIRYAYTDVLIERISLNLKGDQRYSNNWRSPADTSGQGYYISIVTSVYTDAGFTTKSENYGDEENTYLVQERVLGSLKSGGGGLDMRTTRRIVEEEIAKIKFPEQERVVFPKQKEYDNKLSELSKALSDIKALVGSLPTENNDLRPLMIRLNELGIELKTKPVTKETDIKPILENVHNFRKENKEDRELNRREINDNINLLIDKLEQMSKSIPESVEKISFTVTPEKPKEEKKPFNINNLAK